MTSNLPSCRLQISEREAASLVREHTEAIADSEAAEQDIPDVVAAREWLEEDENDVPCDILQIVGACLKDARKIRSTYSINAVTTLTAVTEYVKLRAKYGKHPKCTWPCLNASLAIARRMGKGLTLHAKSTIMRHIFLTINAFHQQKQAYGIVNTRYSIMKLYFTVYAII